MKLPTKKYRNFIKIRFRFYYSENNKKFFFAFEKALDNTAIIDAHPHEATLFKVAVLYSLFYNEDPSPRVIEMSIALRKVDLSHQFKYIEENGNYREADYIELAQQAYIEVINIFDENARNRFEASYQKFKKVYLGVRNPKQINLDRFPANGVNFPEIPDNLLEEPQSQMSEDFSSKPSDRIYVNFEHNELTTLQFLIPEHKKNSVYIPAIGGLALDSLMRACLSKQISIKETKDTELRKRTAAEKFILNASGIVNDGLRAMHDDKTGKIFDPHQGYVGWKADPDNLLKEITKEHEKYQKEQIITQDCKLSSAELNNTFFVQVMAVLKQALANELKTLREKYEKTKLKTSFFDKRKLKNQYEEDQIEVNKKYQQAITEMENFKRIVEQVDAENIMIFAAEAGGKASYSLPKDSLVNDDKANVALAITPRV